jgi:kynurenine formamidase
MENKFVFLSHSLNQNTPCYNGQPVALHKNYHTGTHIDFPAHSIKNGKTVNDYNAEYFVFVHPFMCDINMECGDYINSEHLKKSDIPQCTDLLLIKTGYGKFYREEKYWNDNPGLDKSVAEFLKNEFPKIRAIGMDFISVNAYKNKEPGRKAHLAFLSEPEILLIEDMFIPDETLTFKQITVAPMLIDLADGVPCSIIAETA